ncbi:MAG: hypothetical protein ACE5FM_04400 [Methyloligellaceae bacterium]
MYAAAVSRAGVMADLSDKQSRDESGVDETATKPPLASAAKAGARKLLRSGQRKFARVRGAAARAAASMRAMAGPAAEQTAEGLRRTGRQGWLSLRGFSTGQLWPRLHQALRWLRWRLHPKTVVRDYRRILLLFHKLGPDRSIERLCFVRTGEHVPLSLVRVPHQLRRAGHDYRPTPRLVFKWAMETIPEPFARHVFVDYGAGRGRVLLMASQYPFEKITGAEIATELYDDCLLNIAQYPRSLMKCRDVECQHLSAMRLEVPDQETVFYFHNPFNRTMLERVAGEIVRAYRRDPRRFYVVCVDIGDHRLFEETGIFTEIQLPWRQRLKIAAFSPYSIAIYRSVV